MNRFLSPRVVPVLAALLALASGLVMLNQGALTESGGRVLPLDDSYIHLQYGWQAAQGDFLQYNSGESPSTGATSLLYMLLLAVGFSLGITRDAMPGVVLGGGIVLFMVGAALLADLTRRLVDALHAPRGPLDDSPPPVFPAWSVGAVAGALFAGSGWLAWAYLSGMETGLLLTLLVAALWAFNADRVRLTALLAALAVLTRPETVVFAGMLVLAQIIRDPAETNDRLRRVLWACVAVLAVLVSPLVNLVVTGSPSSTGLLAKSWFTVQPFYADRVLQEAVRTVVEVAVRLFGVRAMDGRWHAFPLTNVLMLIGLGLLWGQGRIREKRLVLVMLGWFVVGIAATATLQTATWHHFRYQMPIYPAVLLPLSIALTALLTETVSRLRGYRVPPFVIAGLGLVAVAAWTLYTMDDFGAAYRLDTDTARRMQIVLAEWLQDNTPEDAHIAVHDVGVMRYVGERPTVDVVGLTTADTVKYSRNGPGAVYEAMARWQPDYYAVYPEATLPYYGVEASPVIFGEELFRIAIEPWSPYTSAEGVQVVTRPDWSSAALAQSPRQPHMLAQLEGWTLVDTLDVADVLDEEKHAYTWWHEGRPAGFLTLPLSMAYHDDPGISLIDGGRLLTGGAAFTAATTQRGEWALIVARVHQTENLTLRVYVNGVDAGLWRLPAMPGEWLETAFLIRSDLVRDAETRIELTVEEPSDGKLYQAFHYWVYQGEPDLLPPAPGTITNAGFAQVVKLNGFDLSERFFAPGDILPLRLYWEALEPYAADHRVFLHLIDPANDSAEGIIAQVDGVPLGGTYPFWVWREHETVIDDRVLAIPPDTPPGEYLLLAGVYDGATGARLPIVGGEDFGADRLILGRITVR